MPSLTVSIETPLSVSSYEHTKVDSFWYLRPTEIKGIWKWWARAFVGGVLYDYGCLSGKEGGSAVLSLTDQEVKQIDKIVGDTLGLGNTKVKSKFRILVTKKVDPKPSQNLGNYQRYRLLTMNRSKVEFVEGGMFRIEVTGNGDLISLNILRIALTLGCLGKAGRRGLGCLRIIQSEQIDINTPVRDVINQVINKLKEVVKETADLSECNKAYPALPPMPIIHNNFTEIYEIRNKGILDLHNFFVRSYRGRNYPHLADDLRQKLEAYVLGLPRGVIRSRQPISGYFSGIDRRASPFILAYHKNIAYLTVFRSADWPKELTWLQSPSSSPKNISLDVNKVKQAYDNALNEFKGYVGQQNIKKVWP